MYSCTSLDSITVLSAVFMAFPSILSILMFFSDCRFEGLRRREKAEDCFIGSGGNTMGSFGYRGLEGLRGLLAPLVLEEGRRGRG